MITPSFALDFKSAILNPSVSFSRALNTATRVNSSGFIEAVNADLPRFDYDPITLACRGLLVEESRANLLLRSENFSTTWSVFGGAVAGQAEVSPSGGATSFKFTENSSTTNHLVSQQVSYAANNTVTVSIYAKASGRSSLTLDMSDNSTGQCSGTFNLTNATATSAGGGSWSGVSAKATLEKNGWVRCSLTATKNAGSAIIFRFGPSPLFYAGNGASGVFAYGAQLEAGAFATSYIPTTTTELTRNADVATITGTNFSDFWQASKGGAQVQAIPSTVSGIRPLVQYDDGTANEIIALRGNTTNPELYVVDGGTPQAQLDAGTIAANTAYSLTGWWATNDCKARQDFGAVVTDDTATIPTVTQARLGSDGTNYLNGHLATVNYYDSFFGQIYTRRKNKIIFNLM